MSAPVRLRCAIYTRKSTEEGLDQEFNSLDAQREACAAFIASQVGLGWKLVPDRYDDSGISGGTMERPALQRLLQDTRDRKIDIVVVYKIDRLTRSLTDFAKMVEVFDTASASFVSVTQQFNTTTSMGRLTLNVLLSFAQFEREVTAERIRDKIAASKAKGMWMGGTIPFGYRVEDRKLVVDEVAGAEVKGLFDRYLQLGSVPALAAELNGTREGHGKIRSLLHSDTGQGRRRPPKSIGRGKLYYMLSNPIYVGKVKHRDHLYQGEHRPIITDATFAAVQTRLADQAPRERGTSVQRDIHLLTGLLFDDAGQRLSPIHTNKASKRYRYYISSGLNDGGPKNEVWRLPARELEAIVIRQLRTLFEDRTTLSNWLQALKHVARIEAGLVKAAELSVALDDRAAPLRLREMIHTFVRRTELASDRIRITIDKSAIATALLDSQTTKGNEATTDEDTTSCQHTIELPLSIKKRGVERRMVIEGQAWPRHPDQSLIGTIARAHLYLDAMTKGQGRKDVARQFSVHPEDVSRLLPLAFLSPQITQTILTGRQPADLSARDLARGIDLPIDWAGQAELLAV
jgi:DNA invertase Pin-like site-specific DNA recombinase